jgi:hypothetical protein
MKATTMLRRQHDRIAQVVGALEHERHMRDSLFIELVEELMALFATEERIFYPCIEAVVGVRLGEHRAEHVRAKSALLSLASCVQSSPSSPTSQSDVLAFASSFRELKAAVDRHIALGRTALLPAVENELGDEALERLGKRMHDYHSALLNVSRNPPAATPARDLLAS